jgi:hypothetical protein
MPPACYKSRGRRYYQRGGTLGVSATRFRTATDHERNRPVPISPRSAECGLRHSPGSAETDMAAYVASSATEMVLVDGISLGAGDAPGP